MTDSLVGLQCPDCQSVCRIALMLLTDDGDMVELASCAKCADGVTIKCRKSISPRAYAEAAKRGLPVIGYAKDAR